MNNRTTLTIIDRDLPTERYEGPDGITMQREYEGVTPNGNPFGGRWVLRRDGEYVDVDQYRYDLAPRHGLELE